MAFAVVLAALSDACSPGDATSQQGNLFIDPVDILVFAPHPDDEVIGTGGVLQQAIDARKRVRIVFATNGDGFASAASALTGKAIESLSAEDYLRLARARQLEAIAADHLLRVSPLDLVFLGYPDGVLAGLYAVRNIDPVRSPTTGRATTYGSIRSDYHTLAHGQPAAYTRTAALADIEEVLLRSRPAQVYVSDPADQHPDHEATYDLVRDAIAATGFTGTLLTYVVHSGSGWPWPVGPTPTSPFASRTLAGTKYPIGVPWPPPVRIALTPAQSALKRQAIEANHTQIESPIGRLYLESFVKSEEVFWTGR